MKNGERKTAKLAVAILAILLLSSMAMLLNSSNTATAQDYGNIMQYDWPQAGADEGNTGWNKGPAPARANVLWRADSSRGSGMVVAFDGMLFTGSGRNVYATDPFDGSLIYTSTCGSGNASLTSQNGIHKLDDTYFVTTGSSGLTVRRISNGEWVSSLATPNPSRLPGSGTYFGGHFSDSMKMYFNHAYDLEEGQGGQAQIVAHDVSDPLNPTVAWKYPMDASGELLCSGGGMVYIGSTEGKVMALDGNGTRVWNSATLGGIAQQSGIYMDGKVYVSSVSWQITCFDAETGEWLWQADKGIRGFSAYRGCAGDGMYFEADDATDPYGHITAWDAETGEQLWSQPAYFRIHYDTMCYADGKVYGITCDSGSGSETAGVVMPGRDFACFDAYTGTVLWRTSDFYFTYPSIAYGNLYGISGGRIWCIGGEPANWDHGLLGNLDHPQVSEYQQAPWDISTPKWEFQAGGDVFSTPAIVDGKVYFGSSDKNWYCVDAYTGEEIWKFETGHYVRASCAVVGGRVFTGSEDGYFYALDAETGAEVWKVSGGGFFPYSLDPNEAEYRSSPVVVGGNVYCGSLDGKVYCLSASDGRVRWTYSTGGSIHGSALYYDSTIYITSTDGYLYAITTGGDLRWRSHFELKMYVSPPDYNANYNIGTPSFGDGRIYVGGGSQYGNRAPGTDNDFYLDMGMSVPSGANGGGIRMCAFDAATGESIWNVSRAGNTQVGYVPTFYDGYIYGGEFFDVTKMDAENPKAGDYRPADYTQTRRDSGNRSIGAWLGYQIQGSVLYAADLSGAPTRATDKIYVGSDIGSLYCLDADDFSTLSVFTAGANVPSSCALWNGRLYVGCVNGKLYCFDNTPVVTTSVFASANKGASMWNNETMLICGSLLSYPDELAWVPEFDEEGEYLGGSYVAQPSTFTPPLPNQTVKLTFTNPDMEDVMLETTTDKNGYFEFSYTPTEVGEWGWVVYYDANVQEGLTYDASYGEWNPFTVNSPTAGPSNGNGGTEPPPAESLPMEYVYAAIAVIVIVVVAFLAYFFLKKK